MIRILALLGFVSAGIFVTPVLADGPSRVFVASTGDDGNDGSRGSPKRSFQAAHDAVASGGSIVALDTAGYGALSITKSVSVTVPPGVTGLLPAPLTAAAVSINAPNGYVSLQGLLVKGDGRGVGIQAVAVQQLVIEDTVIQSVGMGIGLFAPSDATLIVRRAAIRNDAEGVVMAASKQNVAVTGWFRILKSPVR